MDNDASRVPNRIPTGTSDCYIVEDIYTAAALAAAVADKIVFDSHVMPKKDRRMKSAKRSTRKKGSADPKFRGTILGAGPEIRDPERDTMRVRVYRTLARALMAGVFKPGEAVSLRTLAQQLGTSAMPVRESVSRLIAERALVLLPNRSVIVPHMPRSRYIELNEARQMLEGTVTEAACGLVTPALLNKLSEINEAMKASIGQGDLREALSHNMVFHFTLYRAGAKSVILPLIEMLWLQAGPSLAVSLSTPGMRWTARHHHALLAALRIGDALAARRAIVADIEETSTLLLKKAVFEDGPEHTATGNPLVLVSSH
jgi:DNA-binding GntR family transcriptional regulator